MRHEPDPFYNGPLARYLASRVEAICDYQAIADMRLSKGVVTIDPAEHLLRIRPGLDLRQFHYILARATLRITHGEQCAPEFNGPRPKLAVADLLPPTPKPLPPGHDIMNCPECRSRFRIEG